MTGQIPDEERIFHVARRIDDAALRAEYLDQICAGDQALRERVEALLSADQTEQSLLKSDAPLAPTMDEQSFKSRVGQQIGRYKLLQKIGEGGFGVVYMAEQAQPVRRKVALKVIKPGMDTAEVVARFEAERQALAMMDHQNIARVYDGGATEEGRPYFVMELVKGVPITEFCDASKLPASRRLELFIDVCRAIQHAHQKGIIHRDIKPSNVLITLHDGKPVVKVIDFGVAKAINQQLTERTLFTRFGQMVGTPQYMSPEQAEMSGLDVDTRSDIYSLGVLLYQLLTGTTPLDAERIRTASYAEIQRLIREEEPLKPSTRLSTAGEKLLMVAEQRNASPDQLHKLVAGDLDWIVMKSLEKDRNERYESAAEFSRDIQNYLSSEPILARPHGQLYRLRKAVRRNRVAFSTASAIAAVLILATGVSVWQAHRAHRHSQVTQQEKERANEAEAAALNALKAESNTRVKSQRQAYQYGINLAYEAWNRGDRTQFEYLVKELIPDRHDKDFRGIEWRLLASLYQSLQQGVTKNLDQPCWCIDYSPNGEQMAIACGKLLLRDTRSGTVEQLLPERNVMKVEYSTSGSLLISSGIDKFDSSVSVWKMPEKEKVQLEWLADLDLKSASISPDESFVAGILPDGRVQVHDFPNGNIVWTSAAVHVGGGSDNRFQLSFAPNGRTLATGSRDSRLCLWDAQTGVQLDEQITSRWVSSLRFSPDSLKLISTGSDGFTRWDVAEGKLASPESGSSAESRAIAFSPNSSLVAIGASDRAIHLFDTDSLMAKAKLLHTSYPTTVAFHPNGRELTAGSRRGGICSWDSVAWDPNALRNCSDHWHLNLDISAQGLVAHTQDTPNGHKVVLWDTKTDSETLVGEFVAADDLPHPPAMAFSPTGSSLAIGNDAGDLIVCDLVRGEKIEIHLHDQRIYSVDFSPDGSLVATGGRSPALRVLNIETGKSLSMPGDFDPNDDAVWVRFSKDGRLAAGGGDWEKYGRLKLWEFENGTPKLAMNTEHPTVVRSLDFSPDGQRLVITHNFDSARFRVYEVSTRRELFECSGHSAKAMSVMYSHDGQRLISGSDDMSIRFLDASDGTPLGKLKTNGRIRALAKFPVGEAFVSAAREGFIHVWHPKDGI